MFAIVELKAQASGPQLLQLVDTDHALDYTYPMPAAQANLQNLQFAELTWNGWWCSLISPWK
jgi:hypothetical protein